MERAYREYWVVSRTFDRQYPQRRWREVLGRVAADPQLSIVLSAARIQRRNGIALYGAVIPHPTVQPVNGSTTATVRDCQDASHAGQAQNGKPRSVGVAGNPVVGTLTRGPDGLWRVSRVHYPGGRC